MKFSRFNILTALTISLVILIIFFISFYPILNTAENTFALYLYTGGFGIPPTEIVNYNHLLHPFLGWLIKNLFYLHNGINWYSITLIIAHYISTAIIVLILISKKRNLLSYFFLLAIFILFQGYFMLYLDFTGASIVLTISASLLLLTKSFDGTLTTRNCFFITFLFVLASFFRIHSIIPVGGIAFTFILLLSPPNEIKKPVIILATTIVLIIGFNFLHKKYYISSNKNWQQEELYRHKVYQFYNNPFIKCDSISKWHTEYQLIRHGFLFDRNFISSLKIDSIYRSCLKKETKNYSTSFENTKWFFSNNRAYIVFTIITILLFCRTKKIIISISITLMILACGITWLAVKGKAPPYVLVSSLCLLCYAIILTNYKNEWEIWSEKLKPITITCGLFLIMTSTIKTLRISSYNKKSINIFRAAYQQIAASPDKLFILTNNNLLQYFYAFDIPSQYPLNNYLDSEHFLHNVYQPILKRFQITSTDQIGISNSVIFRGEKLNGLEIYYEKKTAKDIYFEDDTVYKNSLFWQMKIKN